MKTQYLIYTSILAGCLTLTGCGSDSSSSSSGGNNNVTADPTTNSTNLTGLWLQSAKANFTDHEVADPANGDLESGDYTGSGTGYTVFQLTDNSDGTLDYQVCAGDTDTTYSYRQVSINNNKFTLPAGTDSADETLPSNQTVTIVDNQNLSFTNFTATETWDDGSSTTNLSNIKAVKIRDDISSPIGTVTVGSITESAYCLTAAVLAANGKNMTDSDGSAIPNASFTIEEVEVENQNGYLNIGELTIDGNVTDDPGWVEYENWSEGTSEDNSDSPTQVITVNISSDFMTYTASSTVGINDTAVSINIDLD